MKELAFTYQGDKITANGIPTGGLSAVANIIQTAVALAFLFGSIFFLFMLIYGGFTWITSEGDKQKLQQARQRLTFAIVGVALIFMSLLIVNLLGTFFNIDNILNLPGS